MQGVDITYSKIKSPNGLEDGIIIHYYMKIC